MHCNRQRSGRFPPLSPAVRATYPLERVSMYVAPSGKVYTLYHTPESRGMSMGDVSMMAGLTSEEGGSQKLSEGKRPGRVPRFKARGRRIGHMTNSSRARLLL